MVKRLLALTWPADALARAGRSVVIVNDRENAPDPAFLQAAKTAGAKMAFSSGGATTSDEARLERRIQAILAAHLSYQDLGIPGKH